MNSLKKQMAPIFISCACLLPLPVQAVDSTAGSYTITGSTPFLSLDKQNATIQKWDITNNKGGNREFSISDDTNTEVPFTIIPGATSNSFFMDFEGKIGLGTNTPGGSQGSKLTISDTEPGITFDAGVQQWDFFGESTGAGIFDVTGTATPFAIEAGADSGTLYVDSASQVGVGTNTPTAKLHVVDNTAAQVLVENLNTTVAARSLFEVRNNGNVKFLFIDTNDTPSNTADDRIWEMANGVRNGANSFRIGRNGTGFIEFEVWDNGNASLHGVLIQNSDVNSKQGIDLIDQQAVLAKVIELPISEWSYKSDPASRHIGPMAQDFYQSFQLGGTEKGIATLDTSGVALAAIQGLHAQLVEKEAQISAQEASLREQDKRLIQLELAVTELLRKQSEKTQISSSQ